MREELPRKRMSLWGPMGLSVLVHGLLVAGAGYLGYRSLPRGDSGETFSEMQFGAEESAEAPVMVPLDVGVAPVLPATPTPEASAPETPAPAPVVAPPVAAEDPAEVALAPPVAPPVPVVPPAAAPTPAAPVAAEIAPAESPAQDLAPPSTGGSVPVPAESLNEPSKEEFAGSAEPESTPETRADLPASPMAPSETVSANAVAEAASDATTALPPPAAGLPEGVISDSQLSPLRTSRPDYPLQDKLKGHQGDVVLLYSLKTDGTVTNIRVFKSSGFKTLDLSAARALAQYKYPEGRIVEVIKTFSFRLKGPSVETPSRWRK